MKYVVHMAVDTCVDVEVDASDPDDAYEKAQAAYYGVGRDDLTVIDVRPVCCEDGAGAVVKEY